MRNADVSSKGSLLFLQGFAQMHNHGPRKLFQPRWTPERGDTHSIVWITFLSFRSYKPFPSERCIMQSSYQQSPSVRQRLLYITINQGRSLPDKALLASQANITVRIPRSFIDAVEARRLGMSVWRTPKGYSLLRSLADMFCLSIQSLMTWCKSFFTDHIF